MMTPDQNAAGSAPPVPKAQRPKLSESKRGQAGGFVFTEGCLGADWPALSAWLFLLAARFSCRGGRFFSLLLVGSLYFACAAGAAEQTTPLDLKLQIDHWDIAISPQTGGLTRIAHPYDSMGMNWVRTPGRWDKKNWVTDCPPEAKLPPKRPWGQIILNQTNNMALRTFKTVDDRTWESVYTGSGLEVTVRRQINSHDEFTERVRSLIHDWMALQVKPGAPA